MTRIPEGTSASSMPIVNRPRQEGRHKFNAVVALHALYNREERYSVRSLVVEVRLLPLLGIRDEEVVKIKIKILIK